MFYKSSLLAVTVVLLSAGNLFALDTSEAIGTDISWMQDYGLDHQSLVVSDISLSIAAKNTGIDAVKSRLIGKDAGSVEMGAEQESQTNKDISGFNVYPVISIGVSYAF